MTNRRWKPGHVGSAAGRRFTVACVLCLALWGCGRGDTRHYELALRYKENGKNEEAIKEFQAALRINPRFARAHNQLGILYGKVGHYDKAVEHCRKAVEIDPGFASAYYNLGVLYQTYLDNPAKALEAYNRYLELRPEGQRAAAVRKIVAALIRSPVLSGGKAGGAPARLEVARRLVADGDYTGAASVYRDLIEKSPRSAGAARLELARLYEEKLDMPRKALDLYQAYLDAHINAKDAPEVMAAVGRLRSRVALAPTPKAVSRGTIRQARDLLAKGDVPRAMAILERAKASSPESEEVHDLLAEAYSTAGDLRGAEKEYEWLKSRQADFAYTGELVSIYSRLAAEDMKKGDFSAAEQRYRKALALAPGNAELRWGYARSLAEQGRFRRALEEAAAAATGAGGRIENTRMAELYLGYARNLAAHHRYENALEAFKKAKSLDPSLDLSGDMADLFEGRARQAAEQGDLGTAEREYREALALDAARWRLRMELASVYERMGRYDAALGELEKVARQGKPGAGAYREMARIYETYKADSSRANRLYRKYLAAAPAAPDSAEIRKKLKAAEREKKKIVEYERAIKRKPASSTTHYNLAVLLQRQGKLREAIEEYRKALAIEPDNPQAHFNLGYSYDRLKMYDRAVREYRNAIRYKPDYVKAYNNLAAIYKARGWYGKAILALKKALEIDPTYAQAHLGLGSIYADKLKDRNKARFHYREYIRLQPNGTYAPQVRAWLRGMG